MKYITILSLCFLMACGSSTTDDAKKTDVKKDDSTTTESTETNENNEEDVIVEEDKVIVANPENTSIEAFEKTSGGMSFCDCVKKSQEMDDEMMADETSDERMEEIMKEKDKLVDGPCAILKVGGQSSAEEREARQRKVKACLSK